MNNPPEEGRRACLQKRKCSQISLLCHPNPNPNPNPVRTEHMWQSNEDL